VLKRIDESPNFIYNNQTTTHDTLNNKLINKDLQKNTNKKPSRKKKKPISFLVFSFQTESIRSHSTQRHSWSPADNLSLVHPAVFYWHSQTNFHFSLTLQSLDCFQTNMKQTNIRRKSKRNTKFK
jgi:hypothetical protein